MLQIINVYVKLLQIITTLKDTGHFGDQPFLYEMYCLKNIQEFNKKIIFKHGILN